MKKRKIQPKTCYVLGIVSCGIAFAAGILMAFSFGPAGMLMAAAMACEGGMLLFLCVTENGPEKKTLRLKLLFLFFALLVSYMNLPPLNYLLEAVTLPFLGILCLKDKKGGETACISLLFVLEGVRVVVRSMALVDYFAPHTLRVQGLVLLVVVAVRFWLLMLLYRQAARGPVLMDENAVNRLR